MFNSQHYVPVLRWKAAEKEALEKLSTEQKAFLTPVVEIIMPQLPSPKKGEREKTTEEMLMKSIEILKSKLPRIPEEIQKYWGKTPIFVDLSLVDISLRIEGLKQILSVGKSLDLYLIPVINLNSSPDIQRAYVTLAKENAKGFCLRLFRSNLHKQSLPTDINNLVISHGLNSQNIDLLVDFQITNGLNYKLTDLNQQIPNILKWRTFTVVSGAFPKDLTNFTVDLHYIDRLDWNCWVNQIKTNGLLRKPSFGDYTIQHPIYSKPIPGMNPSASIRYALKDKWVIMRGEGLRGEKSKGFAQYPANAQLLSKHKEFFGASFSYGDAYIEEKGKDIKTKETGTPRTWLRAGINHHLVCVISQISNLS